MNRRGDLRETLLSMVRRHGLEQVEKQLKEIGLSEHCVTSPAHRMGPTDRRPVKHSRRRRPKPTASQYVAKMELSPEKGASVSELAGRFEAKCFLPTLGDIAAFCQSYDIDQPASKSRANAVPRVFKLLASLEVVEIHRIIEHGLFSGPSRLGPIADAIRRNGRATATAKARNSPAGLS